MACWDACQGSRTREDALNTIVEINGRKALPVRAIPLLTDWRGLSPDELAQILAGDSDYWPSFDGLSAHRLQPDGSTESIPPRWWASWVVRKLQAISDTIKARQITHETGVQQWRGESLVQLPAGVFVWLDEFKAAHANEYGPGGMRARGNPTGFDPSAHALNFNPHPDPNVAPPGLVLEGFGPNAGTGNKKLNQALVWLNAPREALAGQDLSEHEAAWFDGTLDAAGYFALEHVTPVVAAMLLCGFSPHDTTESDAESCATDGTSPEDFKRLRLTFASIDQNRPARRSLPEWMNIAAGAGRSFHPWAHRYAKHHGLYGPPRPEAEPVPTPAQLVVDVNMVSTTVNRLSPPASPPESVKKPAPQAETLNGRAHDGEEWKEQARQRAREIIARQKAKDLYPSQEDIACEIAREFRAAGKPLTGAYIKRHALKGISSATGRKFSTQILKGK